MSLYTEHKNK